MVFNPSKYFLITISRGSTHLPHFYELCGVVLKCVENEKYLGVTFPMIWRGDLISPRSQPRLGFIKRTLRDSPHELKRLSYSAFVRSGLEYVSVVWDPHLAKDKDIIEKTEQRAARWITSTYTWKASVTDILTQINLEPLEDRRCINRIVVIIRFWTGVWQCHWNIWIFL